MSTPARIDELRKKFDENPRRYFAPLANEYRKAGDLPQAIALCREHLPKQPGHMSGHIVYGQALYEAGELPDARTVFESALALDPENLIALRHLGDIAKATGDASAARRWYERVLDADPRNDDIAAQLATLGTASSTPAVPMPSVNAAFAPRSSTPAPDAAYGPLSPTPAFGMGALPTPDAAMRAVDFDVVNAEIARYTPLSVDAIESSVSAESQQHQAPARPTFEPLDLDAMDAIGEPHVSDVVPNAVVDASAAVAAAVAAVDMHVDSSDSSDSVGLLPEIAEEVHNDGGAGVVEAAPVEAAQVEAAQGDGVQSDDVQHEAVASDADDVEFEEGIFAPEWPADTAAIIASIATPRTVTPLFVNVTPDEAVAFGREPHEVPAEQFDAEPDMPVEASAPVAEASIDAPEIEVEETIGEETSFAGISDDSTDVESFESVDSIGSIESIETVDDEQAEEASDALSPGATESLAFGDSPAPEPQVEADEFVESVPADELHGEVGHDAEAHDDEQVAGRAETAEGTEVHEAPEAMAGFATETMGELLVAQGFVERAVDVYQELVRRRPYDPVLTSRLAELRERLAAEAAPAHVTPAFNTSLHNTPLHNTPLHNTPIRNTPLRSTPLRGTPARTTPLAAMPVVDPFAQTEDEQSSLTSRELFARIAARRVPRRTPPQASPAVAHDAAEGLASLFGGSGPSHDDEAAQALADAFAPISAQDMATGAGLDFDLGAIGEAHRSPMTSADVSFGAERTGAAATNASTPPTPASNAGFSFDRFFPDPARPTAGDAGSLPAGGSDASSSGRGEQGAAQGKTTEDLAQFSAWLKGLGGS